MTKLTTELLEKFVSDIKTDGMCEITDSQVESALIKLLAYEQAAKNPAEYKVVSRFGDISLRNQKCEAEMYRSMKGFSVTPLYAAPVLPKQPELIGMKVSIDTGSDNIGHRLFGEIVGTSDSNGVPVLCIEVTENNDADTAPAQPVSEPYKFAKSPEVCAWISDGEGLWLGDCGLTWTFFYDGPNENGLKYCPSCGKKVSFIAAPAQDSE